MEPTVNERLYEVALAKGLRQSTLLSYRRLLGYLSVLDVPVAVVSAQQHSETWGNGSAPTSETWGNGSAPTSVATVAASLNLPAYGPVLDADLTRYTVRVAGWRGTWRIVAERPGRDWNTYLLSC